MKKMMGWLLGFGLLAGSAAAQVSNYIPHVLSTAGWTASASTNSANARKAFDQNITTRWSSAGNRTKGMWYKVDFGAAHDIDSLLLDMGSSAGDYPSGYKLEVSTDDVNWTLVASATMAQVKDQIANAQLYIQFPWVVSARYIRMTLTESKPAHWSIYEISIGVGDTNANYPPRVEAGVDQVGRYDASFNINGSFIDDGKGGGVKSVWSKVSGPGNVTFQNPAALNTTATVSLPGNYVLKLTVSDGALSSSDTMIVYTVQQPSPVARASNPFITHMFTADPSAHVWADGRLYVYPSTDVSPPKGCNRMDGYHIFSTDDMVNWTDHGEILHSRDLSWGIPGYMWAPDCAYKNGVYYYYFPHRSASNAWAIGVATSASPTGGFVDRGTIPGLNAIDPCVFTDDDGQVYMVYGGANHCEIGKLKPNMVEIDGSMTDITSQLPGYHEGPWMFKRNAYYYLMYPDGTKPQNQMLYAMSTNPMGPWDYKGLCILPTDEGTMHGSIVEYKGKWWAFYHNRTLSGMGALRSICFDEVFFNADGTMQLIMQTINPTVGVNWPSGFDKTNYAGIMTPLRVGTYTAAQMGSAGLSNNVLSSLQVPAGYAVELYSEDNFQGTQWTVSSNVTDLSSIGCGNQISSLKVKLGASTVKYEAEAGVVNIASVGTDSAASGGACVKSFNRTGASVTFTNVNGLAGGEFYLNLIYASSPGSIVGLEVNGARVYYPPCRKTESMTDYTGNIREKISLQPGMNTIKLFQAYGPAISLDYITLTPLN